MHEEKQAVHDFNQEIGRVLVIILWIQRSDHSDLLRRQKTFPFLCLLSYSATRGV